MNKSEVFLALVNCVSSLVVPFQIINIKSLSLGIFSKVWKLEKVVPIFRSGDDGIIDNYRPISILSSFA